MFTSALSRTIELIILLICLDLTLAQWSSCGEPQSFTCVTPRREGGTVIWQLKNKDSNESLFQCNLYKPNDCDPYSKKVLDTYSARNVSNATFFITVFTIKSITLSQHNTTWFCKLDFPGELILIDQYDLKVFAPASNPTCNSVTLESESNFQIICSTEKVFPQSICLFDMNINGSTEKKLNQEYINYKQEQDSSTQYYKTTCTFIGPVTILGPGSHMFRVVMYPNITLDITDEMKSTSEYTLSTYLAYPKARLGTDCTFQGYIKENKQSNCTCYDNSNSLLPTIINWSNKQTFFQDKGTIVFIAKREELFQCTISNHLNWTDTIYFQPKISYPPDTVSVKITNQLFDICNDMNTFILGTCFVSEGNPEPSVTVNINNSLMDITSLKYNGEYMFNSTKTAPGIYYISCLVNSMEYYINESSTTKTVIIKGPPEMPKIFKQENEENESQPKHLLEITKGDTITCRARGGYPILKNISLKCGPDETHAINQDQVSMVLSNLNVSNGTCKCVVWHESICLQNTSTVQFKVITMFIDDSNADHLNDSTISGIVISVIVVLALIVLIIFLVRRYNGQSFKNARRKNQNETHNYDHVSASQYVNTEMHAYETSHIKTSYVNVLLTATATFSDLPKISNEQASTQNIDTEIDQYESADMKKIYIDIDPITDSMNVNDSHEYDTTSDQAENCYSEIIDTNAPIDPGSA